MKKLGILGILVFLVALAFVPHGVMAAQTDTAALTIRGGVQEAIEVTVDSADDNPESDPIYGDAETYLNTGGALSITPSLGSNTEASADVGTVKIQSNFPNWDLKVHDGTNAGIMKSAAVPTNALANELQIAKVKFTSGTGWASTATYQDVTDTATTFVDATGDDSERSGNAGVTVPVNVKQLVTFDDPYADDYSIVLTFTAGHF